MNPFETVIAYGMVTILVVWLVSAVAIEYLKRLESRR